MTEGNEMQGQMDRPAALVPKKVFFTTGVGRHKEMLESFEMALRDAGIEKFNLVTVSSILPPKCDIIEKPDGLKILVPGEIVFTVMSRNSSNEPAAASPRPSAALYPRTARPTLAICRSTTPMARARNAPAGMPGSLSGRCSIPGSTSIRSRSAMPPGAPRWTRAVTGRRCSLRPYLYYDLRLINYLYYVAYG